MPVASSAEITMSETFTVEASKPVEEARCTLNQSPSSFVQVLLENLSLSCKGFVSRGIDSGYGSA